MNIRNLILFVLFCAFVRAHPVMASVEQLKVYRSVYPDVKPNCMICHIDKVPKKGDGQHELNAYGQAVLKAASEDAPTAENYTSLGRHDEFEAEEEGVDGEASDASVSEDKK